MYWEKCSRISMKYSLNNGINVHDTITVNGYNQHENDKWMIT